MKRMREIIGKEKKREVEERIKEIEVEERKRDKTERNKWISILFSGNKMQMIII